ncbi:unnamed protein product, partial [Gulo gulo]
PPPTWEWAFLVPVLQVARGQKVTSLTACLVDQSLRLDCRHENSTTSPIQYEFSLTREKKKHVLYGTMGVPEHSYRSRTNFTSKYNIKVLYLSSFTTKDEGTYTCELRLSGQPPITSSKNVSVLRGEASSQQGQVSWKRRLRGERAGGQQAVPLARPEMSGAQNLSLPPPNYCLVP